MRVKILNEVKEDANQGEWTLCFQHVHYMDQNNRVGYRFIWRRPDGSLQAARGQARLPSIDRAKKLMDKACADGWGTAVYS
jgi:hypothetical protein